MTDVDDDGLDAAFAALVEEFVETGLPPWHSLAVDAARRLEDDLFGDGGGPEMTTVREFAVDGLGGAIPVRAYRPTARQQRDAGVDGDPGVLVFAHGGVFVLGTLDSADDVCRELAARTGRVVLSVDYRLAPEHPFPAAVEDAVAATEWAADCQDDLGGADRGLAVAGDSAGGNLAAVAALVARDSDGPDIDHQALVYPVVSAGDDWDSYRENGEGYFLERESMAWFEGHYFDSEFHRRNPYAFPLAACDLSGLPPATVLTAGYDPLRDEGAAYADRLAADGVAVSHHNFDDVIHGFVGMLEPPMELDRAHDAVDVLGDALGDL